MTHRLPFALPAALLAVLLVPSLAGCDVAEPTTEEAFLRALGHTSWDTRSDPDRPYSDHTFDVGGVRFRYSVEGSLGGPDGAGSSGTYGVRPVEGDPGAYVVTYAPQRGQPRGPDVARLVDGCRGLVLEPVGGGRPLRLRKVPSALAGGPPCPVP